MRRVIFWAAGLSAAALAAIGLVVRRRWAVPDEMLPVERAPAPPVPSAVMPLHAVEPAAPTTGEPELAAAAAADAASERPEPTAADPAVSTEPSIEAAFGPVSAGPVPPPPIKRAAKPRARSSRTTPAEPTEPATGD